MGGGGEAGAVADGDQQDGGGPDADAGHRRQDRGKRVGLQQGVDLGFQGPALFVDSGERAGQGGHDDVELPRGFVERKMCPDDRRGIFAALTAAGRARYEDARPTHRRVLAEVLGG